MRFSRFFTVTSHKCPHGQTTTRFKITLLGEDNPEKYRLIMNREQGSRSPYREEVFSALNLFLGDLFGANFDDETGPAYIPAIAPPYPSRYVRRVGRSGNAETYLEFCDDEEEEPVFYEQHILHETAADKINYDLNLPAHELLNLAVAEGYVTVETANRSVYNLDELDEPESAETEVYWIGVLSDYIDKIDMTEPRSVNSEPGWVPAGEYPQGVIEIQE